MRNLNVSTSKVVMPLTISLAASQHSITVQQVQSALASQVIAEVTPRFSDHPSRKPTGDFRDWVTQGFSLEVPQDVNEQALIRARLIDDAKRNAASLLRLGIPSRVPDDVAIQDLATQQLSRFDMNRYWQLMLNDRLGRMLKDDIAKGHLRVSQDGRTVSLDDLVAWSIFRNIAIEQQALPGCAPLVHASYQAWTRNTPQVTPKAVPRAKAQEDAIMSRFAAHNVDPNSLPKQVGGKSTIKAELCRELLKEGSLFSSKRVFEKAWSRLLEDKRIRYV